ncbi:MAG: PilZ domain-containing protein [Acidobacteriota bacterium]
MATDPRIDTGTRRQLSADDRLDLSFDKFAAFVDEYSSQISLSGLFVPTEDPRPVGSVVAFDFRLTDGYRLLHGLGEVVWARPVDAAASGTPGMGLRFLNLDESGRELVLKLLEEQVKSGGAPFEVGEVPTGASSTPPPPEASVGSTPPAPEPTPEMATSGEQLSLVDISEDQTLIGSRAVDPGSADPGQASTAEVAPTEVAPVTAPSAGPTPSGSFDAPWGQNLPEVPFEILDEAEAAAADDGPSPVAEVEGVAVETAAPATQDGPPQGASSPEPPDLASGLETSPLPAVAIPEVEGPDFGGGWGGEGERQIGFELDGAEEPAPPAFAVEGLASEDVSAEDPTLVESTPLVAQPSSPEPPSAEAAASASAMVLPTDPSIGDPELDETDFDLAGTLEEGQAPPEAAPDVHAVGPRTSVRAEDVVDAAPAQAGPPADPVPTFAADPPSADPLTVPAPSADSELAGFDTQRTDLGAEAPQPEALSVPPAVPPAALAMSAAAADSAGDVVAIDPAPPADSVESMEAPASTGLFGTQSDAFGAEPAGTPEGEGNEWPPSDTDPWLMEEEKPPGFLGRLRTGAGRSRLPVVLLIVLMALLGAAFVFRDTLAGLVGLGDDAEPAPRQAALQGEDIGGPGPGAAAEVATSEDSTLREPVLDDGGSFPEGGAVGTDPAQPDLALSDEVAVDEVSPDPAGADPAPVDAGPPADLADALAGEPVELDGGTEPAAPPPAEPRAIRRPAPTTAPASPPRSSARRVQQVEWSRADGGTVVWIRTDGRPRAAQLEHDVLAWAPDRERVKLLGFENFRQARVDVGTPELSRIRIGHHPGDELHLVFDLAAGGAHIASVEDADGGVRVLLKR